MPPSKKRGRPPKYVNGRDGKPIVGLSFARSNRQYYAAHSKPRVYFGSDFDKAVVGFRVWEASRRGRTLVPVEVPPPGPGKDRLANIPDPVLPDGPFPTEEVGSVITRHFEMLDEQVLFDWARDQLLSNPTRFAERTGIEAVAWINDLEPPGPSLTLRQVGNLYFGKRRKISTHWDRKQKAYWKEFTDGLGVKSLRDLTQDIMNRYHNKVWDEYEKNDRSPTYAGHRFQAVKTILRHALKKGRDQQQVRRVLDLTASFEVPNKSRPNPRPINRADFQKLIDVADEKWRAVFLLSLNCAFYPSEVADVQKEHIDLEDRFLVMDRGKTGVPRVAVLWDRTVAAIREYDRSEPHKSPHVFVSATGMPYNANHMGRNFRRRRAEAGLPESVTFDAVRDGAYTAAVEGGASIDHARMLSGQRVGGVTDYYLKRNPRMVADACAAIERAYFG